MTVWGQREVRGPWPPRELQVALCVSDRGAAAGACTYHSSPVRSCAQSASPRFFYWEWILLLLLPSGAVSFRVGLSSPLVPVSPVHELLLLRVPIQQVLCVLSQSCENGCFLSLALPSVAESLIL